ncbi:glycosyltransferase family 2 protein [Celeribacter halophilus]|uniref:glycosyltransferase family 2 protein n=1 Tax=Celeribacter halophilus TaxID=576117 RepID=UPI003A8C9E01
MVFTLADVTVVLPAFNAETTLGDTFKSLEPSLAEGMSLILVDDASTDQTPQIMTQFADRWKTVSFMPMEKNVGAGVARNIAMDAVNTPLMTFIDGDDWVGESYYKNLVRRFSDFPDLDFVRSHFIECYGTQRGVRRAAFPFCDVPFDPKLGILPDERTTLVDQAHVWPGMYSTEFLNRHAMRFLPLQTAEERKLVWERQMLAKKCLVAEENQIFYRRGISSSLTHIGDERQLDILAALKELLAFVMNSDHPEFLQKAVRQSLAMICFHLDRFDRLLPHVQSLMRKGGREVLLLIPPADRDEGFHRIDARRRTMLEDLLK